MRTLPSLIAAALAALSPLSGCSVNPATGRTQLVAMSPEREREVGAAAAPELTAEFGGAVHNAQLQAYVTNIGRRLAAVTEADYPSLPWEFTLLDSAVINAFALPGGKVFITRGLASKLDSEAQLAAILGHEVGHVTARHSAERMAQQGLLVVGGTIIGAAAGAAAGKDNVEAGAAAGATVGTVVALSYSRDQEIVADRLGMRYMEKLYYDPAAAIEVQQILKREGGGGSFNILATHPPSDARIAELHKRYDKYYAHTKNNPQYQKHPDRYRQQFLSLLATLPPPRQQQPPTQP